MFGPKTGEAADQKGSSEEECWRKVIGEAMVQKRAEAP
jgi:hypothetical protein